MTDVISPKLGPVQETLLIPLYGRATLTRQGSALINDPKAVEMVERIDYDFTPFDGTMSLLGAVFRARIFDHWISRWLVEHPTGTVVEIGAGLDTRYERIDNGQARWLELDLPDATELRRRFFTGSDRRAIVAGSVLDDDWYDAIPGGGPCLFAAEAVLIYLDPGDVTRLLARLARRFPGATLVTDTWTTWMADHQQQHDTVGALDAEFRWFCDDLAAMRVPGATVELLERCTFTSAPQPVTDLLPEPIRQAIPALATDPQISSYHQNLAVLHPA
jgi:O-methyltransferase involved in polyketide biosynthesis